jgi:hypothetical protein
MRFLTTGVLSMSLMVVALVAPASFAVDDNSGYRPLFNGSDLSGWVPVQVAPTTFTVRDGLIVCTGVPTGVMRTERQYENFILELDYMHLVPGGNSGLFIWSDAITAVGQPFTRAIEVQILDGQTNENYTSHGDVFSIHGAHMKPDRPHPGGWERCLPSEHRANPAGQWNHYRVECNDGSIKLAVNGKVVSGGHDISPRKGYVCLESEGGTVHFRNIRIKELPPTGVRLEDVATPDEGFKSIYTGTDLAGWVQDPGHKGHWQAKDWRLVYDGKSEAADKNLWTEKEYGDFVLIADWRFTRKPETKSHPVLLPSGDLAKNPDGTEKREEVADAGDSGIYLRGSKKAEVNLWCQPAGSGEISGYRTDKSQPADVRAGATPKARADKKPGEWNRIVITMAGDHATVAVNGRTVIENTKLPGVPSRGRIGLQHHDNPIEFANLYVRELK